MNMQRNLVWLFQWKIKHKIRITRELKETFSYKESSEEEKKIFLEEIEKQDKRKLVYLDESVINQQITREYGWSNRGEQVFGKRLGKRFKKINIVAG